MDDLTKEQKALLSSMYKEVLSFQPALSFEKANFFLNSNIIRERFLPDLSLSYVTDLCFKLKSKGYISCYPGDNLALVHRLLNSSTLFSATMLENTAFLKSSQFKNAVLVFVGLILYFRKAFSFPNAFRSINPPISTASFTASFMSTLAPPMRSYLLLYPLQLLLCQYLYQY